MSVNKFIGIGKLGKDPETRKMPNGNAVTNFSIAISEKYKDKSGEKKEITEWVNIVTFGKLAEIAGQYLKKGQQVFIEGKLKTEKYEKNEQIQYSTKIVASSMEMLGGKRTESQDSHNEAKSNGYQPQKDEDFDDALPF